MDPGAERGEDTDRAAGYRRSAGSKRGEARRQGLLERVVDDLAANGLTDFSLRRAARAAGTTHKVLLYYFDSADDLLAQAVLRLRARRIDKGLAAAPAGTLGERVRSVWPVLLGAESRVLDQAMGLTMYDPDRYAELGRGASQQYLPALVSLCPPGWTHQRKHEVAALILAAMRGFLVDRLISLDASGVAAGLDALVRVLDREELSGD